jgi:hypothetical protein
MYEITMSKMFLQTMNINHEPNPKSPINWILRSRRMQTPVNKDTSTSVSGFPLNCLFGAESIMDIPYDRFVKNKY